MSGMPDQQKISGRCYCGGIHYEALGPTHFQANCHCENCRRAIGAQAVAWISVSRETFAFVMGSPRRYQTDTKAWRTFCADCGTSLTYESPPRTDQIDIITATLDNPQAYPPVEDAFAEERLPWVPLLDHRA